VTFMKRTEDNPAFLSFGNDGGDALYGEGVYIGHRYYEKCTIPVNFPLGYGLSYLEWKYSNLVLSFQQLDASDFVRSAIAKVSVDVTNSSQVGNALETILCFVSPICTASFPAFGRPLRELKAFTKISVDKGETKTATMKLDKYAFSYWHPSREQWIVEGGDYELQIVDGKYLPSCESKSGNKTTEGQILKVVLKIRGTAYWNGL
jgi:beta-glucosidase